MSAQNASAPASTDEKPVIRAGTEEVVMDVVVRDKRGKAVTDLTAADFEVLDNNVQQEIQSFRLVEGREAIEKGAKAPLDPLRQIRLVTLAFERLGVEGRRMARMAANDLLKGLDAQNVFYSVVMVDQQLIGLQPFTSDRELLKAAIEKATGQASGSAYVEQAGQLKQNLRNMLGPQVSQQGLHQQLTQAASTTTSNSDRSPGASIVSRKQAEIFLKMLSFEESMGNDQSTRRSIFALLSLIRGQMSLPGRKTIVYYSEGMSVPDNLDVPFRSIMSTANAANVTIYPIDARGLGGGRENSSGTDQLASAMDSSRSQLEQGGAVRSDQAMVFDTAQTSMRANDRGALANLAEGTGGFLIANTNDLRGPLRRVAEDVNSYYEITYKPQIENYDGSLRQTAVHLKRPNLKVQARNGYFALPRLDGNEVLQPYEIPLLKALTTTPLPKGVEFRSAALKLQPVKDGIASGAIIIEVPMQNVKFAIDEKTNTYKARIATLALLKDANGTVIQKWSRDLPLQGPADRVPAIQQGNFIYKELFALAPGRYTLETAVLDGEATQTGAKRASLAIAPQQPGVAISNVTLVRSFQPNAKDLTADDPFQFQGGKITPTLNGTIKASPGSQLSMFFVVYPDPGIAEKASIVIEYIKDGQTIGQGALELPAPDSKGRIPYVMSSSAEQMPPGAYEIRALAKQGSTTAEDRAFITVER